MSCREVQRPPLRDETIKEGGLPEALRALLRDGLYDRVVQSFWYADQIDEGELPEAVLLRNGQYDRVVHSFWYADQIDDGELPENALLRNGQYDRVV